MSSGQKPRWRSFYPKMKNRGKHRRDHMRIIVWGPGWDVIHWWKEPLD